MTGQEASQLANGDCELVTDTAARQLGDVVGTCRVTSQRVNADGAPATEPDARQLDDGSLTGQGASHQGNTEREPRFDPIHLWLMLFQAGYEPW